MDVDGRLCLFSVCCKLFGVSVQGRPVNHVNDVEQLPVGPCEQTVAVESVEGTSSVHMATTNEANTDLKVSTFIEKPN